MWPTKPKILTIYPLEKTSADPWHRTVLGCWANPHQIFEEWKNVPWVPQFCLHLPRMMSHWHLVLNKMSWIWPWRLQPGLLSLKTVIVVKYFFIAQLKKCRCNQDWHVAFGDCTFSFLFDHDIWKRPGQLPHEMSKFWIWWWCHLWHHLTLSYKLEVKTKGALGFSVDISTKNTLTWLKYFQF